jgi:hypothetical protein
MGNFLGFHSMCRRRQKRERKSQCQNGVQREQEVSWWGEKAAGELETIDRIDACCAGREDGCEGRSCVRLHGNVVECRKAGGRKKRQVSTKQSRRLAWSMMNTMVQRQQKSESYPLHRFFSLAAAVRLIEWAAKSFACVRD